MAKRAADGSLQLTIPEIRLLQMTVRIASVTPLLCNRFSEAKMHDMEAAQQADAKVKKPPRDPEAEFLASLYPYTGPESAYGFPAAGLKKAMVTAGQRFAGEKATELKGMFSIPVELIPILAKEPTMRKDRVVLSGMSRVSSIAYRAQFMPWAMEVPIKFNEGFISPDQLVNLLSIAGFAVGAGDWRPEKSGSFGQFKVDGVIQSPTLIQ